MEQGRRSSKSQANDQLRDSRLESKQNKEQNHQIVQQQQLQLYQQLHVDDRSNSLFPSRQELPWYWKYAHQIDIFAFEPVPTTSEMSTRRSQFASIACIFLMLAFVGFTMYQFFFNNAPRLNTYSTPIDYNEKYKVQDFAFGFYEMDTNSNLIEDASIFTYYLEQYVYSNLPSDKGHEELSKQVEYTYCTPDWAPIKITMLCPKEEMYMQGMIGKGDYLMYPRLKLLACSEANNPGIKCDENKAIAEFPKGRLFIFVKQDEQINFAAGKTQPETVPQYYIRAETIIGTSVITKQPDFGTSFSQDLYNYKSVINNYLYLSDVSYFFQTKTDQNQNGNKKGKLSQYLEMQNNQPYIKQIMEQAASQKINTQFEATITEKDKADAAGTKPYFAWWMSISQTQAHTEVNYQTSVQMISLWGGLWGVLCAAFTFIYMTYNAKQFYKQHKVWDNFDKVVSVIDVNRPSIIVQDSEIIQYNQGYQDDADNDNNPNKQEQLNKKSSIN